MHTIKLVIQSSIFVLFPLIAGSIIYLFFRPNTTIAFQLLGINHQPSKITSSVPNWILYNLPDGLWLFSFVSTILIVCKIFSKERIYALAPLVIAIIAECAQNNLIAGTFDIIDILFYTVAFVLSISLLKKNQYEKKLQIF